MPTGAYQEAGVALAWGSFLHRESLPQAFAVDTHVRFVIYPWLVTVTQGYIDSIEGV